MTAIDNYFDRIDLTHKNLHARFLNTLSMLEFKGAEKIANALPNIPKNNFVLEHVYEEFRHAFFLRTLANKISHEKIFCYSPKNILNFFHTKFLLQKIEINNCRAIKKNKNNFCFYFNVYILTTFCIENFALNFYDRYQNFLNKQKQMVNIKSILSEEKHHLLEIKNFLKQSGLCEGLIQEQLNLSQSLFDQWLDHVTQSYAKEQKNNFQQMKTTRATTKKF